MKKDIISERYGISEGKIAVIPAGFYPDKFWRIEEEALKKTIERYKLPPRFVLALGRITPYKGYDLLVKAMQYVIKKMPDIKLILRIGSQKPSERELHIKNELLQLKKV